MQPFVNIAAYKFVTLGDLPVRRKRLLDQCRRLDLKGTILLSAEGINLFLAGTRAAVDELLADLRAEPGLADLEVKESLSDHQPFTRMLVRLKKEIIAFGVDGIDPRVRTSKRLSPTQLKAWLDEGRAVTLLDTRNDYEVKVGTFDRALPVNVDEFRDFPRAVRQLPESLKDQTIVTFCTGGIRCEKAAPFLEQAGFKDVYQLDGGILKYFEECGGAHYRGECFVFDQRVALNPELKETDAAQCFVCQSPLLGDDTRSPLYVPGKSCPHCHRSETERTAARIAERHEAIRRVAVPLPGSTPYENLRPLNVPERFAGRRAIEFLTELRTIHTEEAWRGIMAAGRLVSNGVPLTPDSILNPGQRLVHHIPATTEPDVNADIRILFEDDTVMVLNKPAPLPMHPCGRFNRNSLQYILDLAFGPQLRVRPAHRLDSNTSGVLVCTKARRVSAVLQPQFERGEVTKTYLARVRGEPASETFDCEKAVGREPGRHGARAIDPEGLPARTSFRVLTRFGDGTTLLEVTPHTGRTNQIRLHLQHLRLPIVGDVLYSDEDAPGERQTNDLASDPLCLHAWRIRFRHPVSNHWWTFTASPPAWADVAKPTEGAPIPRPVRTNSLHTNAPRIITLP